MNGTITGLHCQWGSGIALLIINGHPVPCENPAAIRALDAAFGDVIIEGHTVDDATIIGKEIEYEVEHGVLSWFAPVEGA